MSSFPTKCACCGLVLLGAISAIEHETICQRDEYCKVLPPEMTHGPHDQQRPLSPRALTLAVASSTSSLDTLIVRFGQ
jgi:hypothetical protein